MPIAEPLGELEGEDVGDSISSVAGREVRLGGGGGVFTECSVEADNVRIGCVGDEVAMDEVDARKTGGEAAPLAILIFSNRCCEPWRASGRGPAGGGGFGLSCGTSGGSASSLGSG